jgi:methylenetetrahydrofolate dehydrogenase (NADP+)/methenyltetrahydrofolate cyclohydrolase
MQLIDGKELSRLIKEEIAADVEKLVAEGGKRPHLAAILVGTDGASETYVANKVRSCERVGFESTLVRLEEDTTEEQLLARIDELNRNEAIDGFICQLPLPAHIDEQKITLAIDPKKDVDGFHPINVGRMVQNLPCFLPATPFGILQMLERYNIETEGRECVVLGRSNIVGMPMSILLARKAYPGNCTVTLCHSRTRDLADKLRQADILVAALGRAEFVTGDMVKEGAVVIDVGITRVPDATKKRGYALKGDVHFESVAPKCSFITPVPGGVGPMTVTSLLMNTLRAARKEVYQ